MRGHSDPAIPSPRARPPICLIANPAAGRGRGGRALAAARTAMAVVGVHDVRVTTGPGEEERLAERAAGEGVETIVALGGDGTWGNVARGILASGRDVRLALMAAGTGNDFGQSLGLPVWDWCRSWSTATAWLTPRVFAYSIPNQSVN